MAFHRRFARSPDPCLPASPQPHPRAHRRHEARLPARTGRAQGRGDLEGGASRAQVAAPGTAPTRPGRDRAARSVAAGDRPVSAGLWTTRSAVLCDYVRHGRFRPSCRVRRWYIYCRNRRIGRTLVVNGRIELVTYRLPAFGLGTGAPTWKRPCASDAGFSASPRRLQSMYP